MVAAAATAAKITRTNHLKMRADHLLKYHIEQIYFKQYRT
jgi:hypothetical protein